MKHYTIKYFKGLEQQLLDLTWVSGEHMYQEALLMSLRGKHEWRFCLLFRKSPKPPPPTLQICLYISA